MIARGQGAGEDKFSRTAIMMKINENKARPEDKTAWSVVVVYDDAAAREKAVDFCDQLVERFWARFQFDVNWWSFGLLATEATAAEAADSAARADLVILFSLRRGDFPRPIKDWIESWLARRSEREGILAGLVPGSGFEASGYEAEKHHYLRDVAHRGAMDYLTQLPQSICHSIPESLDFYMQRAEERSSVLEEILCRQPPPPLIN